MKSVFNFIFIAILISTIYGGIANNTIYTFILIIKYIFILSLILFSLILFKKKVNIYTLLFLCIFMLFGLITNIFNSLMFVYVIQLYSIFLISLWLYRYYDFINIIKKIYTTGYIFLLLGFIFLIFDFSLFINHSESGVTRYAGFYGNAIWWGFTNATLTIFGIYLFSIKKEYIYLITAILTFIFCLLSGTRGALLLVILFLFFYFLYHKKILLLILTTISLLLLLLNINILIELITREGTDDILSGRSFIWLSAYEQLSFNYFNGYGFKEAGKELLFNGYKGPGYHEDSLNLSLHNSYLEILFGNGMVFLGIVILFFKSIIKKAKKINKFIYSYLLAFMVASIFESFLVYPYFFSTYIFYLLIFYLLINTFYLKLQNNSMIRNK